MDWDALRSRISESNPLRPEGRVVSVQGLAVRFTMPSVHVGDVVWIRRQGTPLTCEVVGFEGGTAVGMPLGSLTGVGPEDIVEHSGGPLRVPVHNQLLGRVVNGLGEPIDGGPALQDSTLRPVDAAPPSPMERMPISEPLPTGVRAIDGILTVGKGQRVGLFAGSGVGKSTLLGAIARGVAADVVIVALVGERGREVAEFLEHTLGPEGRKKSIVVVATSDRSPLERLRAAEVATAYAEHFRDQGASVMLLVDSVTRYARAAREVGLAAGEPPARRGYPPSVFAMLPKLLERSGQGARGSITALYTVLVEGGDMEEPIADEVRGILDGHIVMDRAIAARGRYPAIDISASLSRVMSMVTPKPHQQAAVRLRELLGLYESKRDLVLLGAYKSGSDPELDAAIAKQREVEAFLKQSPHDVAPYADAIALLEKGFGR
jgi:ATP synthase in type III secretion protein N